MAMKTRTGRGVDGRPGRCYEIILPPPLNPVQSGMSGSGGPGGGPQGMARIRHRTAFGRTTRWTHNPPSLNFPGYEADSSHQLRNQTPSRKGFARTISDPVANATGPTVHAERRYDAAEPPRRRTIALVCVRVSWHSPQSSCPAARFSVGCGTDAPPPGGVTRAMAW